MTLVRQELSQIGDNNTSEWNYPTLENYLKSIGIEKRYLSINENRLRAKEEIDLFTNNILDNIKNGNGLIISGPVGVGKTVILSYIASKVYAHPGLRFDKNGRETVELLNRPFIDCRFIRISKLYDLFHSSENQDIIRQLIGCDLLLLDDFGAEYSHDFALTKFEDFIEERYSKIKSTIITTNIPADQLSKDIRYQRVVDRWRDNNTLIQVIGISQRKKVIFN